MATAQNAAANQKAQILPFRGNSRLRRAFVTTFSFGSSSPGAKTDPKQLPEIGYLARVVLNLYGTMTLSAPGAFASLGPWNIFNRIVLGLNNGAANIWDMDGFHTFVENMYIERGFRPDGAAPGAAGSPPAPHVDQYAAPVASGANSWNLQLIIPVALNMDDNFQIGLVNLQSDQVQCTLQITWGALADAVTNATSFSGSCDVYYDYFEVPPPQFVAQPNLYLVRGVLDQQPITQTGTQTYKVPRQGILAHITHDFYINGVRSDAIDGTDIQVQNSDVIQQWSRRNWRLQSRLHTGVEFPTGVYGHDFMAARQLLTSGDLRDAFDSEKTVNLYSRPVVTAGTTLGASNNTLYTTRRIIQALRKK